jgi:hypothetical protein
MRIRRAALAAAILVASGCGPDTVIPTPPAASGTPSASASENPTALLAAPWGPAPLSVEPTLVTAVEFACKNPADPDLKAAIERLPVALIDARGDSLVSLVLADDHVAFECRVGVEDLGGTPTVTLVEPPSRLVPDATAPIEPGGIRIVSNNRVDEDRGSRSIALGRVASGAEGVIVALGDDSEIEASIENGWFLAWWPSPDVPGEIAAVNEDGAAISSVKNPDVQVEGRVGPAFWWLDPAAAPLSPDATTIPALISERACASGQPPGDRVVAPEVFTSADAILATVWIRKQQGGQDCQGNPAVPLEIPLGEPVGNRRLLDGSEIPPRDASVPPR